MRVLNDSQQDKKEEQAFSLFSLPFYALLCGIGISTLLLSPFAMIMAHVRLPEYWPKVACIGGAIAALMLLEVPLPAVLVSFILGTFIADSVMQSVPFWKLTLRVLVLASLLGVVALVASSPANGGSLSVIWNGWVDAAFAQLQQTGFSSPDWNLPMMRNLIYYEGPFLMLAGIVLSLWVSVGLASHLGWFAKGHTYSQDGLRALRLPFWVAPVFVALFALNWTLTNNYQYLAGGLYRLASVALFIQGLITLSHLLNAKGYSRGVRGLAYGLLSLLGFYALVALGLVGPWILNRRVRQVAVPAKPLVEEAV